MLLGFDDEIEKAFIADRIRDVPEACSYAALIRSRNPPEGMSTFNLWGRFHGTDVGNDLVDAARGAIARCATRMLGGPDADPPLAAGGDVARALPQGAALTRGIAGIRAFAADLPGWAARPDAAWVASFNARCIEKFGNGGGNFRRLYAGFLEWARGLDPALVPDGAAALCVRAADGWTAIAECLGRASETVADTGAWRSAAKRAAEVADVEQELFERLADRSG